MRHAGRAKNSVWMVSFFGPTSKASRRPMGGVWGSCIALALGPHAAAALRLGARLDLPHALAREAEDLADIAQRQLVVLQHTVAELHDRLLFERQRVDGLLHGSLLPQILKRREEILREIGAHVFGAVVKLVPVARPRFRIEIGR